MTLALIMTLGFCCLAKVTQWQSETALRREYQINDICNANVQLYLVANEMKMRADALNKDNHRLRKMLDNRPRF